jgi:tRNA dimethylallyltransferase
MQQPVLAVVGPTASGKSTAAMAVARARADVELVAVDAFTIYRGMDIGTAKPSPADRAAVPHHCIDLLGPTEEVDVAWFQGEARAAIRDVHGRGHVPLLVGGSGLYFRAVVDDMRFPPHDPDVRARLEQQWDGRAEEAHAAVAALDPDAAARIEPGNLRRSVRALEVMELTDERFSDYADTPYTSVVGDLQVAHLEPPTEVLRDRIAARSARMVERGLVDEVARIRREHGTLSTTASQGIGYGEAAAVLDGELDQSELAERIATRTWAYARRQRSWFRKDPRCQDPIEDHATAADRLLAHLGEAA